VVEKLKQEYDVDVEWRPFYLYFDTPPEGRELPEHVKQARASGSEERLKQIAGQHGMRFQSTRRIYNTRLAHEATEYAREHGKGIEFHRALFRRVYAEGEDPSQWGALRATAGEVGLNVDELQAQVESGKYTEIVEDQVKSAYQLGVTGVPTYVINNRYAIVGAQPYEVFQSALAQILKQER
jgi:predicted DsbA family dithiol-disulfide isomerase